MRNSRMALIMLKVSTLRMCWVHPTSNPNPQYGVNHSDSSNFTLVGSIFSRLNLINVTCLLQYMYNDNKFTFFNCKCKFSTQKLYQYFIDYSQYGRLYRLQGKFLSLAINIFLQKYYNSSPLLLQCYFGYIYSSHTLC